MIDFTIETHIERPVAEVFAYATDPAMLATWQRNTVSAELEGDAPLRAGSRLREVHRGPGGRELASVVEVATYEPDRAFALRVVEGALPIDADLTFVPAGAGATELRMRCHGAPRGAMRLLTPVLGVALRRQFREHCANLKRVLEQAPHD